MALTFIQAFELALFMALMLAVSMLVLSASGHFPKEHRGAGFRTAFGSLVLFGSIALTLAALVLGIFLVQSKVPWYALVIGGGAMVLITPLVLPVFSDKFVDGRGSLLTFSGCAAAACGILALLH